MEGEESVGGDGFLVPKELAGLAHTRAQTRDKYHWALRQALHLRLPSCGVASGRGGRRFFFLTTAFGFLIANRKIGKFHKNEFSSLSAPRAAMARRAAWFCLSLV